MALAPVTKMTNALVEIGLILISVSLGLLGLPIWVIAVMLAVSSSWWGFVHHVRLSAMVKSGLLGGVTTVAMALAIMAVGHGIGYGLGRAFHEILGLK